MNPNQVLKEKNASIATRKYTSNTYFFILTFAIGVKTSIISLEWATFLLQGFKVVVSHGGTDK